MIEKSIYEGTSDREIARLFGIIHVSVGRHRRDHILKVAQDKLAIVAKGARERKAREETAAAAASDAPSAEAFLQAHFGAMAQGEELLDVRQQLRRAGAQAELMSPTAVPPIAAQRHRNIELGGKLTEHPGFVPARLQIQPGHTGNRCNISIFLGGKEVDLSMTPHTEIDGAVERDLGAQDVGTQDASAQNSAVDALLDRQFLPKGSANRGSDREPAEGDDSDGYMPRAKYGLTPDDIKGY